MISGSVFNNKKGNFTESMENVTDSDYVESASDYMQHDISTLSDHPDVQIDPSETGHNSLDFSFWTTLKTLCLRFFSFCLGLVLELKNAGKFFTFLLTNFVMSVGKKLTKVAFEMVFVLALFLTTKATFIIVTLLFCIGNLLKSLLSSLLVYTLELFVKLLSATIRFVFKSLQTITISALTWTVNGMNSLGRYLVKGIGILLMLAIYYALRVLFILGLSIRKQMMIALTKPRTYISTHFRDDVLKVSERPLHLGFWMYNAISFVLCKGSSLCLKQLRSSFRKMNDFASQTDDCYGKQLFAMSQRIFNFPYKLQLRKLMSKSWKEIHANLKKAISNTRILLHEIRFCPFRELEAKTVCLHTLAGKEYITHTICVPSKIDPSFTKGLLTIDSRFLELNAFPLFWQLDALNPVTHPTEDTEHNGDDIIVDLREERRRRRRTVVPHVVSPANSTSLGIVPTEQGQNVNLDPHSTQTERLRVHGTEQNEPTRLSNLCTPTTTEAHDQNSFGQYNQQSRRDGPRNDVDMHRDISLARTGNRRRTSVLMNYGDCTDTYTGPNIPTARGSEFINSCPLDPMLTIAFLSMYDSEYLRYDCWCSSSDIWRAYHDIYGYMVRNQMDPARKIWLRLLSCQKTNLYGSEQAMIHGHIQGECTRTQRDSPFCNIRSCTCFRQALRMGALRPRMSLMNASTSDRRELLQNLLDTYAFGAIPQPEYAMPVEDAWFAHRIPNSEHRNDNHARQENIAGRGPQQALSRGGHANSRRYRRAVTEQQMYLQRVVNPEPPLFLTIDLQCIKDQLGNTDALPETVHFNGYGYRMAGVTLHTAHSDGGGHFTAMVIQGGQRWRYDNGFQGMRPFRRQSPDEQLSFAFYRLDRQI